MATQQTNGGTKQEWHLVHKTTPDPARATDLISSDQVESRVHSRKDAS